MGWEKHSISLAMVPESLSRRTLYLAGRFGLVAYKEMKRPRLTSCSKHPNSEIRTYSDGPGKTRNRCLQCNRDSSLRIHRRGRGHSFKWRYAMARRHAVKSNREFSLTFEEYNQIVSSPCVYKTDGSEDFRIGLDRKDNTAGYTLDNSLPSCSLHNAIKSNVFTYEQMIDLVHRYNIKCGSTNAGSKKRRFDV